MSPRVARLERSAFCMWSATSVLPADCRAFHVFVVCTVGEPSMQRCEDTEDRGGAGQGGQGKGVRLSISWAFYRRQLYLVLACQ